MRCLSLLLFALLAPLATGQVSVDPVERHVVVSAGKSTKITVDAGECAPTWTASSSNTSVADVTPTDAGDASKRTFSVKTSSQGSATVTITASGAGTGCADEVVVEVTIVVVMDTKAVTKFFKKELKAPLKTLKTASKTVVKDTQGTLKGILAALKDETLGNLEGPGGLTHGQMADLAVTQGETALADGFAQIFDDYVNAVINMKDGGENTALLYGFGSFLGSLPPGFFEGGCGEWDKATASAWQLFVGTVDKLNKLAKKFDESVVKEAGAETGISVIATMLEVPEFTTGGISIGSDVAEFGAGEKALTQKRPKATNYVDAEGSNEHGRIRAKGKADPDGGTLSVTYERLDSNGDPVGMNEGDFVEDADVTVDSKCRWRSRSQTGIEPVLKPGRWRVTATQGGNSAVRYIEVPTPSAD